MAGRMRYGGGEPPRREREQLGRFKAGPESCSRPVDEAFGLIRRNRYSEAESILSAHLGSRPDDREALCAFIQLYSKAGKLSGISQTVAYATEHNLLGAKFCTLAIRAYGKMNRLDEAVDVFNSALKKGQGDSKLVSAAIEACDRCDCLEEAEFVMDEARSRGLADLIVYTQMMNLYDSFNEQERTMALFSEARSAGVTPDLYMYTAAIGACGRSGAVAQARKLFDEADSRGMADSMTYTSMITTYRKRGKAREAAEIFQRAVDKKLVDGVMLEAMQG